MKKVITFLVLLNIVSISSAQKAQSVAYIDMEYILENVPEYLEAQNTLDAKVSQWKKRLDDEARYIEVLKTDLANEKAILTKDLIEEKEEEISLKQEELRRLESLYFGPNGDMFNLRKQLVEPVQDQIYNAVQDIAAKRKYDFVFDKSSEPIMLYSNKKYDISELILSTINKDRKIEELDEKRNISNPILQKRQEDAINAKKEDVADKIAEKEEAKKEIEDRRAKALKLREEKRKILREKQAAQRKKKAEEKKKKQEAAKKKKEEDQKENNNKEEDNN